MIRLREQSRCERLGRVDLLALPVFAPERGVGARPGKRDRILIVEDDYFVATDAEAILTGSGYEVVGIASSAEQATAAVEAERPELVLMDIRLAGPRDGIDAATEIWTRFGVRCVFATAHADPATRKRAEGASPVGWIGKPFAEAQLLEAVAHGLKKVRDERQT